MARKDSTNPPATRGFSDTIGIALIASALLLMVALVTHDRHDLSANSVPPNETIHNLGGPIGAWVAEKMYFVFGAGAFVLPLLMLRLGLAIYSNFSPIFANAGFGQRFYFLPVLVCWVFIRRGFPC